MKISDQVCSLEQAKRLKELGVVQESFFVWVCLLPDPLGNEWYYSVELVNSKEETLTELLASAFTVAELGVMLPELMETHWAYLVNDKMCFVCFQVEGGKVQDVKDFPYQYTGNTEAQARAAMLIHLLENNLTSLEEINQCLQS